jgi:hypothetical protein
MKFKTTHTLLIALAGTAAYLGLFISPASAATSPCSDPDSVTNLPTGPATVSAASTPNFGQVLIIGSGGLPHDRRETPARHGPVSR